MIKITQENFIKKIDITLTVHHCFFSGKGVGKSDKIRYSLVKWQEFHATVILLPTFISSELILLY